MARTVGRVAGILLAAVTALLAMALPALAHNEFKSSNPKAGATLDAAPTSIVLTFSEELIDGQTKITVKGPDGADASAGSMQLSGPTATVPFKPTTAGAYTVAYKVLADDGDVTDSSLKFSLTAAAIPTPSTSSTPPTTSTTSTTATTSSTAAAPAPTDTSSGTPWWPWLVGALVLVAIVVAVLVVRRRRTGKN